MEGQSEKADPPTHPTPQLFDDKPLPLPQLANPLFVFCLAFGGLVHNIVHNTGTWKLRIIPLMAPHSII